MKIVIFSDVHSNLEALEAFLSALKKENPSLFIFVGDVVGYGADPEKVAKKIKEITDIGVAGNHDYAVIGKTPLHFFNEIARRAAEWTMNNITKETKEFLSELPLIARYEDFTIVHGSFSSPESWEYILSLEHAWREFHHFDTQIGVVGHSHVPFAVRFNNEKIEEIFDKEFKIENEWRYLLNPGSIGQPRDGDPRASFIIYDKNSKIISFKKVKYDVKKAQEKIIKKGLPHYLAERLAYGR